MKKSILKMGLVALGASILFSGCGGNDTVSIPSINKNYSKTDTASYTIYSDMEWVALGVNMYSLKTSNYKYAFAMAANLAKKNGFKYFSIQNQWLDLQFKDKDVKTVDDAFIACTEGKGSFKWEVASLDPTYELTNCDKIVSYHNDYGVVSAKRWVPIAFSVSLHNENRNDNVTFNTDEVLNSPIIKVLDMSKIESVPSSESQNEIDERLKARIEARKR